MCIALSGIACSKFGPYCLIKYTYKWCAQRTQILTCTTMTNTCRCVKSIKTCEITSLIEHTMELNIHFFVDQSLREAQTKSTFLLNFTNGALKLQNISQKKVSLLSSFHFFSSFFSFPFFLSSFLLLFIFDGGNSGGG